MGYTGAPDQQEVASSYRARDPWLYHFAHEEGKLAEDRMHVKTCVDEYSADAWARSSSLFFSYGTQYSRGGQHAPRSGSHVLPGTLDYSGSARQLENWRVDSVIQRYNQKSSDANQSVDLRDGSYRSGAAGRMVPGMRVSTPPTKTRRSHSQPLLIAFAETVVSGRERGGCA